MNHMQSRAFTLIELLAVIAVIAILAALLFPAIGSAFEKGRSAACINNMKQMASATLLYAGDNEGRAPGLSAPDNQWEHMVRLGKYLNDPKVFQCPSAKGADSGLEDSDNIYMNPSNNLWVSDYKMNTNGAFMDRPLSSFKKASQVVCFIDIENVQTERHRGGRNLAFMDGRVEWKKQAEYRGADATVDGKQYWHAWGFW